MAVDYWEEQWYYHINIYFLHNAAQLLWYVHMMTSSNGTIFRFTDI